MDKKILSAAIAGALAGSMAFAANADVTLYGQVDVSIDSVDADNGYSDDRRRNAERLRRQHHRDQQRANGVWGGSGQVVHQPGDRYHYRSRHSGAVCR